jgi:peptide/nickel transport system ATP-binding protein
LSEPVLTVTELRVGAGARAVVVEDVSFELAAGEALGIVGESGSGKTTVAQALLGYARTGLRIISGSVRVAGEEILDRSERELRSRRGRLVSYVPQDPGTALNPSIRVGNHVREVLKAHSLDRQTDGRVRAVLERVELPSDASFQRRFPHQLSGGQQQRLAIALALVCDPPLVVLDEPTTGLDVVTQSRILDEISRLQRESSVALVYVSHDLAVVSSIADRVAVMYAGRIVEEGPTETIVTAPRHPYSAGLIVSVPDHVEPRQLIGIPGVAVGVADRPAGCAFAARCDLCIPACEDAMPKLARVGEHHFVRCIRWQSTQLPEVEPRRDEATAPGSEALLSVEALQAVHHTRHGTVVAAEGISFAVDAGACVALVGESGSGKTTIARCIVGLHPPSDGRILVDGRRLAPLARQRSREERRTVQIVFQNPYDSLNPRRTVEDAISWPARSLRGLGAREARTEVATMLERVRLPAGTARRYPGELSGGERQRVAIARALAARPKLLVCDEVTSALDVSIQAAVLDLLAELRRDLRLSLLFISHDLGVVASVADRVLVLELGLICEEGAVRSVLSSPQSAYTARLVEAAPSISAPQPLHDATRV